ncbi:hypothetical protein ABK040_006225 [Willaertia magna]
MKYLICSSDEELLNALNQQNIDITDEGMGLLLEKKELLQELVNKTITKFEEAVVDKTHMEALEMCEKAKRKFLNEVEIEFKKLIRQLSIVPTQDLILETMNENLTKRKAGRHN